MLYRFGAYELDEEAGELRHRGAPVPLQPKPFELLRILLRERERVVSAEELFDALWPGVAVTPGSLTRAVSVARRAIGDGHRGALLRSVAKRGYRFTGDVVVLGAPPAGAGDPGTAGGVAAAALARGALVGREAERARLRAAFAEAAAGHGALVLVAGPAGIGKTRLVEEVAEELAAAGARVAVGRARDGDGVPAFWPIAQVLRQLVAADAEGALARELAASPAELAALLPGLPDAPGRSEARAARAAAAPSSPEEGRFLLFDAVARALAQASRSRPLLVVLEDVQWAGPASLRLLEHLSLEVGTLPILLVATVRDEPGMRPPGVERALGLLRQQPRCSEIALGGLSRREVAALLEAETGRPAPPDLTSELFARTEGVPLFLREAIRLLAERGALQRPERVRRWAVTLPAHVLDLIRRPLERLSPPCAELLAAASVLGREFPVALAAAVAEQERAAAVDLLDEAETAGVVEASPETAASWRFTHALFHEAVYARLPAGRRARLHARAAAALETLLPADADDGVAELAHHHHQALAVGDPERAFAAAVRAAGRARRLHAYEEAALHWTQAAAALDHRPGVEPRVRFETLLALGEAHHLAGDRARREEAYGRAFELARETGTPDQVARAAIGLCDLSEWSVPDAGDREAIEAALALLGERRCVERARLLARVAYLDALDDPTGAAAAGREALALARESGDDEALDEALYALHTAVWTPDGRAERAALAREFAARPGGPVRGDPTVIVLLDAAVDRLGAGDPEGARRLRADAEAAAGPRPHPGLVWHLHAFDAGVALLEGRLADAERIVDEGERVGLRIDHPYARGVARGHRALLARERGDAEGVLRVFDPNRRSRLGAADWVEAVVGRALAAAGRAEEASARFARLFAKQCDDLVRNLRYTGTMVEIAHLCADVRADEAVAPLLERLAPLEGEHAVMAMPVLYGGPVAFALGRLLALEGRLDAAAERFERAEQACEALAARPTLARVRVEHGALLLRRGARRAGRERLAAGAELADALGLERLAALARGAAERAAG